jgi:hypothetical protein
MDEKLKILESILESKNNKNTRTYMVLRSDPYYSVYVEIETMIYYCDNNDLPWYKQIIYLDPRHRSNIKTERKTFSSLESFDKPLQEAIEHYSQHLMD